MAKRFHLSMPLFALSHSSHGTTSPIMATSMSLSARVQPQCRHILQSTWCARPIWLASTHLNQWQHGTAISTEWERLIQCPPLCFFYPKHCSTDDWTGHHQAVCALATVSPAGNNSYSVVASQQYYTPVNKFNTEEYISCAFPPLFPTGAADYNTA